MTRILVTGGAGFIGHHLVRRLLGDGHTVTVFDNFSTGGHRIAGAEYHKVDVSTYDPPILTDAFDQVYHLACPASPVAYQKSPITTLTTGVIGTYNMLRLAARCNARVLLASSSEVYGSALEHPQHESYRGNVNTLGPRACYDEAKRAAEALAWSFVHELGLDARVARIHNTFGPSMAHDDGRLIPNLIAAARAGKPLPVYAPGSQTRSLCYVDDLVEGLVRLMKVPHGTFAGEFPVVNLGSSDELSVLRIAEEVRRLVPSASTSAIVVTAAGPVDDPPQRCPNLERAFKWLGWRPTTSLEDGLRYTIAAFRARAQDDNTDLEIR